jgi:hypothetical protein
MLTPFVINILYSERIMEREVNDAIYSQ